VALVDPVKQEVRSRRAWFLSVLVIAAALVLAGRLFDLQVLGVAGYALQSEQNRVRREWITAPRGLILDREGRVLADSRPSFAVLAVPRQVAGDERCQALLAELLEMPVEKIRERLGQGSRHVPRVIRHDVAFARVSQIAEREEELPGVSIKVTNVRYYPQGSLAAHILGHVGEVSEAEVATLRERGYKAGDFAGRTGLERAYEDRLRGEDGEKYLEVDAVGRVVGPFAGREPVPPRIGATLNLHLDSELQALAESLLTDERGAICMMDVGTGGILALASSPTFDPNLFATGIASEDWERLNRDPDLPLLNRCVQATYAPGSTFKMIPMALALEKRILRLREHMSVACYGGYRFGNRTFRCWEELGHGSLDLEGALVHSCDTYFYQLGERLTVDQLAAEARAAGLGAKTGIDLPQELAGNVPTSRWFDDRYGVGKWTRGALLNLVIGQGEYLVTPLQLARYAAALANGGELLEPRLVRSADSPSLGEVAVEHRVASRWQLRRETLAAVQEAMRLVVADEEGTGRGARTPGFEPAGKTGTAENPHGPPHSWFIGYAPAQAPQVSFSVIVEAGGHGSDIAVPIARQLLRALAGKVEKPT
jgi:penicillin-binding protein 2